MTDPRQTPTPKRGRPPRSDRQATRERLIDATIKLLGQEGVGAISTVRLSAEAGIVQSGFYAHFPSLEDCLKQAAERIGQHLRLTILGWMQQAQALEIERVSRGDPPDIRYSIQYYSNLLELLEREWGFVELFLRYRRDPSILGQTMAALAADFHRDVSEHLRRLATLFGLEPAQYPKLEVQAHLTIAAILSAAEARGSPDTGHKQSADRELWARLLAAQIFLPLARLFITARAATVTPETVTRILGWLHAFDE